MLSAVAEQRIAALPTSIFQEVVRICETHHVSHRTIIEEDFFFGYLTGLPVAFDNLSEALGGLVRKVLFDSIYLNDGEEFSRRSIRLIANADPNTKFGFGFGATDGEQFLQTISQDRLYDNNRYGLKSMLDFKLAGQKNGISSSFDDLASRKNLLRDRLASFPK